MNPILRPLSNRIRDLRKAKGLNQEELAERAHIHPTFLSLIERGANAPTVVTLTKIASALGVPPSELLSNKSPSLPLTKKEKMIAEVVNLLRKQSPKMIRTVHSLVKDLIRGLPS